MAICAFGERRLPATKGSPDVAREAAANAPIIGLSHVPLVVRWLLLQRPVPFALQEPCMNSTCPVRSDAGPPAATLTQRPARPAAASLFAQPTCAARRCSG